MPRFAYTAKDRAGAASNGEIEAASRRDADPDGPAGRRIAGVAESGPSRTQAAAKREAKAAEREKSGADGFQFQLAGSSESELLERPSACPSSRPCMTSP